MHRFTLGALLATLIPLSAMLSSCSVGGDCTTDYCDGPLNIYIEPSHIPDGGSVELVVKERTLNCSTRGGLSNECNDLTSPISVHGQVHYEVKSTPKNITIRILDAEGTLVDEYEERPEYHVINAGSCSTACHKNATITLPRK